VLEAHLRQERRLRLKRAEFELTTTYYQPMSGSMGTSESGFHPPAASFAMVKRSMAYTATIRPINTPQVETCTTDGYMSDVGARHQEIVHKPTDSTSDILKSQMGR
jgi:hypothetical protein